jgi:Coenzyme PQQ synthesis protein D (PqqD)
MSDAKICPAPAVHTRLFDGELVILDLAKGEYLALDPIGSRLWRGLEDGRSVAQVAQEVVDEYDVSIEQATRDLQELVDEFLARGLFVLDEEGPAGSQQ